MKQIFDWLREQIQLSLNEPQYYHEGEDFYNGIIHAEEIINEAEAKWEAENTYRCNGNYNDNYKNALKVCPCCGKPIKISEVE